MSTKDFRDGGGGRAPAPKAVLPTYCSIKISPENCTNIWKKFDLGDVSLALPAGSANDALSHFLTYFYQISFDTDQLIVLACCSQVHLLQSSIPVTKIMFVIVATVVQLLVTFPVSSIVRKRL